VSVTRSPAVEELVVTGPERERLHSLFSALFVDRSDVRVILDRRAGERRRARATAAAPTAAASRPPGWCRRPEDGGHESITEPWEGNESSRVERQRTGAVSR
jgi:hypothetical protein